MNSMVARAVGLENEDPMLLVGFGESNGEEGRVSSPGFDGELVSWFPGLR